MLETDTQREGRKGSSDAERTHSRKTGTDVWEMHRKPNHPDPQATAWQMLNGDKCWDGWMDGQTDRQIEWMNEWMKASSLRCHITPTGQKIIYILLLGTFQLMQASDDVHRPQPSLHCQRAPLSLVSACNCPMLSLKFLSFPMFSVPASSRQVLLLGPSGLRYFYAFEDQSILFSPARRAAAQWKTDK